MNTGIQDAYNLAWKLALVLAGAAPASAGRRLAPAPVRRAARHQSCSNRALPPLARRNV
jgi:2-polyprenyl-6-methoxyphenol hydroxylase-like FAD-dependent oxidoreductase